MTYKLLILFLFAALYFSPCQCQSDNGSGLADYPGYSAPKKYIGRSHSGLSHIHFNIFDTLISFHFAPGADTVRCDINYHKVLYKGTFIFINKIGSCSVILQDQFEKSNDIVLQFKSNRQQFTYGPRLLCDYNGFCKTVYEKIFYPVLINK
jgi:hypothetical protein